MFKLQVTATTDGREKRSLPYCIFVWTKRQTEEKKIKFITSFMKPIMKSPVMVVEQINKVELIAFRTFVRCLVKENTSKKPDLTTTSTCSLEYHLRNSFNCECFERCFQFQFNIRFVQFRKKIFSSSAL